MVIIYNIAMWVCLCTGTTDFQIIESVKEGYDSLTSIAEKFGIGHGCGSCVETVEYLIEETIRTHQAAPVHRQDLPTKILNNPTTSLPQPLAHDCGSSDAPLAPHSRELYTNALDCGVP